jgi:tripartite-type tricarboxylate transporter receptor subunit TctC
MHRHLIRKHPVVVARLIVLVALSLLAVGCRLGGGGTAAYPTKPVELVVPFAPGGGQDLSARLIAGYASRKWGQPVNVVNMTGASGMTGVLHVVKAAPDGYSLLMDGNVTSSLLAASQSDMPVSLDERTYMGRVSTDPLYYMTFSGSPFQTLKDAMDAAKRSPDSFTWGAGAFGSSPMFSQLKLFKAADLPTQQTKMVVFEQGNAPSLQALAGGNVLFGIGTANDVATFEPTGRVRVLGTTAPERTNEYPNVPTAAEQGYTGAEFLLWYSVSGPPKLPDNVVQAWEKLISEGANDPALLDEAARAKRIISYIPGKDVRQYIDDEFKAFLPLAREAGIRRE